MCVFCLSTFDPSIEVSVVSTQKLMEPFWFRLNRVRCLPLAIPCTFFRVCYHTWYVFSRVCCTFFLHMLLGIVCFFSCCCAFFRICYVVRFFMCLRYLILCLLPFLAFAMMSCVWQLQENEEAIVRGLAQVVGNSSDAATGLSHLRSRPKIDPEVLAVSCNTLQVSLLSVSRFVLCVCVGVDGVV